MLDLDQPSREPLDGLDSDAAFFQAGDQATYVNFDALLEADAEEEDRRTRPTEAQLERRRVFQRRVAGLIGLLGLGVATAAGAQLAMHLTPESGSRVTTAVPVSMPAPVAAAPVLPVAAPVVAAVAPSEPAPAAATELARVPTTEPAVEPAPVAVAKPTNVTEPAHVAATDPGRVVRNARPLEHSTIARTAIDSTSSVAAPHDTLPSAAVEMPPLVRAPASVTMSTSGRVARSNPPTANFSD